MKFDRETHTYTLDGTVFPSVTQVLPKRDFFCTDQQLEQARDDGIENHSMIKMYYDTGSTSDPMLAALYAWLKDNAMMLGGLISYEKPIASKRHRYAGTPDAIYEKAIIDYKRTPGDPRYHALQLAGYQIAAIENNLIKKTKVWIIAWYDGVKWNGRNVYDMNAEQVFLSLVKRYYINAAVDQYLKN